MGSAADTTAWQSAQLRYALPVEEARTTLRVSLQVRTHPVGLVGVRVPKAKTKTEPHTAPWGQLAPTVQVAHEAFQDGLFTAEELEHTVVELRSEYEAALEALGVDAASLPDPSTDVPPPPRPASRADTYRGVRTLITSLCPTPCL